MAPVAAPPRHGRPRPSARWRGRFERDRCGRGQERTGVHAGYSTTASPLRTDRLSLLNVARRLDGAGDSSVSRGRVSGVPPHPRDRLRQLPRRGGRGRGDRSRPQRHGRRRYPARMVALRIRGRPARDVVRRLPARHSPERREGADGRGLGRRHAAVVPPPRPSAQDHGDRLQAALRAAHGADRRPAGVDRRDLPALRLRRLLDGRPLPDRPAHGEFRAGRAAGRGHVARRFEGRAPAARTHVPRVLGASQRLPASRARLSGTAR